jgi:hypothetical protein
MGRRFLILIMTEDLETQLKKDPHIIEIHHSSYQISQMPNIDINLWEDNQRSYVKTGLDGLSRYLTLPMIQDVFLEHDKRIDWRCQLSDELMGYYRKNSLNINSMGSAFTCIDLVKRGYIGENAEEYKGLLSLPRQLKREFGTYDNHNIQEKMEFIITLKKSIYNILDFLGKQKPLNPK